jgi:hypothetical protein
MADGAGSGHDRHVGAAVRLRYLTGLRRGWRSWLVLAVLTGLTTGLALTAAADARRTWSALPRALRAGNAADLQVSASTAAVDPARTAEFTDAVGRLPGADQATRVAGAFMARIRPDGSIDWALFSGHALGFITTPQKGERLNRDRLLEGRRAAVDAPNEVVVNRTLAEAAGWSVGTHVTDLRLFRIADLDENMEPDPAKGLPVTVDVVGIVEPIDDVLAGDEAIPRIFLTPAFEQQFAEPVHGYTIENVRLRDRADGAAPFRRQVEALAAERALPDVRVTSTQAGVTDALDGLRPQVIAIWLLGLVLLAAAVLLAGQAIGRQVQAHEPDLPELRALGMTRRQRRLLGVLHGATIGLVASAVAVLVAIALSPFTPLGSARAYEWQRGLRVDATVLVLGALLVVTLLTGAAVVAASRVARRSEVVPGVGGPSDSGDRPSRAVELAAGAGASPAFVVGMRMALQPGRGRTAAPVRSVMVSIALAVALVVATAAFAADLQRLVSSPTAYGQAWDAAVGTSFGRIPDGALRLFADTPYVDAVSGVAVGDVEVGGKDVPTWGLDLVEGTVFPTLERGRLPQSESEIVLGRSTAGETELAVGDAAEVTTPVGPRTMTVVGIATFPQLGHDRFSETSLGTGAATVASVMGPGDGAGRYNYALVRFREGVDQQATTAQLRADVAAAGCSDVSCVLTDLRPRELNAYARLRGVWGPALLALGALLAMTLAHGLVTSARARRQDLAILGALGLSRPQTRRAVTWEAVTLAGFSLLVGIPVGLAAASLAWLTFARSLGVSPGGAVPGLALAAIVVGVLLAAALVGALCSSKAVRSRRSRGGLVPALELR